MGATRLTVKRNRDMACAATLVEINGAVVLMAVEGGCRISLAPRLTVC